MNYIARVNLKTDAIDREKLIDFCLGIPNRQYLAIGWSCVYEERIFEEFPDQRCSAAG